MSGWKNIQFFLGDRETEDSRRGGGKEAEGGRERDKQVNYKQRDIGED